MKTKILLFMAIFLNAICWTIIVPIWQYPDEQAHFSQVQDTAEFGFVPEKGPKTSLEIILYEEILGTKRNWQGINKYTYNPSYKLDYSNNLYGPGEYLINSLPKSSRVELVGYESTQNPPLYYFAGAILYKFTSFADIFTRVYAVRFMSVLVFMINILVAYKIAKLFFENRKLLQIILMGTAGFTPMLVFASTGVLPDTLTNALFSTIIYISLLTIKNGIKVTYLLTALIILILGLNTRQQFLIALPIYFSSTLFFLVKEKRYKKFALVLGITTTAFIIFLQKIALPEIGHLNLFKLFSGDFANYLMLAAGKTYRETFVWYWGNYRWLSLNMPVNFYQIIKVILLIATFGIIKEILFWYKNKKINYYLLFLITSSLIYASVLFVWDFFFQQQYSYSFGIQGRYFFPTVIAHIAIIISGIKSFFAIFGSKFEKYSLTIILFLMMAFNLFTLFFLSKSYYSFDNLSVFINQVSQYKPILLKGNMAISIFAISIGLQAIFVLKLLRISIKK